MPIMNRKANKYRESNYPAYSLCSYCIIVSEQQKMEQDQSSLKCMNFNKQIQIL